MILGRDAECAVLRDVLEAARAGRGAALVLSGEPGAGKSVLLADVVASATDLRVLRTRGVESESPLAFAALHRLLRPVMGVASALPERQATALRVALGETDGDAHGPDRFLVYLAALTLLSEAAADRPVLVAVDDAHWLDDASREALLFVARRTEGERMAVLLAVRDDAPFDRTDLPELAVGGLDEAAARAVLSEAAGGDVPHSVVRALVERTAGNALALSELARALAAAQLLGREPLPEDLPLTGGVESAFLDRYRRLDAGARAVLLVAAADDSGRLDVVLEAARLLGADDHAADAAETSALLNRHGDRVELRHPLVRSAVYAGATTSEKRRVHAALAQVLRGPQDADRRAWHRAAAAEGPDDAVVGELETTARRSAGQGGHESASAAWERAAELTADAAQRGRRLYEAASAAWLAGRPQRAAVLADGALRNVVDPGLRADAATLRARVEWNTGSVRAAHQQLLHAAASVAPTDPVRARAMGMLAASLAAVADTDGDVDPLSLVGEPTTPVERCCAQLLKAFVHLGRGDWASAVSAVHAAAAEADGLVGGLDGGIHDLLPNTGLAALHLALDDVALRLHERLLATAREQGALIMVLYALTRRGAVDVVLGRWDELRVGAQEALRLAEGTGRPGLTAMPRAWLAVVAALRGEPDALVQVAEVERIAAAGSLGTMEHSVHDLVRWVHALLADSPATALHHLEHMSHGFAERMVAIDRLEAAVHAGRVELADRWIGELADFAAGTGSAWAAAVTEHGRALRAEGDAVEQHLVRAIDLHEQSPRRMDAARTRLAYGEWLRRSRRRVDARAHLRGALQTFEDLGAHRWAARAAQELRASGETARRRATTGTAAPQLTPTELQVARLVGKGLATRDVAAELFVSPRTVDFHLRNVFTKLGVTSRVELARADLG